MILYRDLDFSLDLPCVLALGCFDGVHAGHAAVISRARALADKYSLPLTVFTFSEPARNFFSPGCVPLILSEDDKTALLSKLGVDITVSLPLSADILSMSAQDFVQDIILDKMRASHVVCGYNYTFGKNAAGTPALLSQACAQRGVEVTVVPEYTHSGQAVSSSVIRSAITDGDMQTATAYLCRPFSICASVVDGQHLARRLGFPTVNVIPPQGLVTPRRGVYVSRVLFDGDSYFGITNIGMRPTVDTNILCAETHIFDFDGDLYGKRIRIEFLHFLREETKFESIDALSCQVTSDIEAAKQYIKDIEK